MSPRTQTLLAPPTQQHIDLAKALVRNPTTRPVVIGSHELETAVDRVMRGFGEYEFGMFARTLEGAAHAVEALELGIAQRISSEALASSVTAPNAYAQGLMRYPDDIPVIEGDPILQTALRRVSEGFSEQDRAAFARALEKPDGDPSRVALEVEVTRRIEVEELKASYEADSPDFGI